MKGFQRLCIHDRFEVIERAIEKRVQRFRVTIEVDKNQSHLHLGSNLTQAQIAPFESTGIVTRCAGNTDAAAIGTVGPVVVEAGNAARVACRFNQQTRAAMRTGVDECADLALGGPDAEKRLATQFECAVVKRRGKLALMADQAPGATKDTVCLPAKNPFIGVNAAGN